MEEDLLTTVKVQITEIKYYDKNLNRANTIKKLGRITVINCRKLLRQMDEGHLFISKTNHTETFQVSTEQLYSLKV